MLLKIGEFAALCQSTVKTLRFYDHAGLLAPDYVDAFSGYCYYHAQKLNTFRRITVLKEAGFSLTKIKGIIREDKDASSLIARRRSELQREILQKTAMLKRLDTLTEEGKSGCPVTLIKSEPQLFASVRVVLRHRDALPEVAARLEEGLRTTGLTAQGPLMVVNNECAYRETDCDLTVGYAVTGKSSVAEAIRMGNGLELRRIPPSEEMLSVICGESGLANAYTSLTTYAARESFQIIGTFTELRYADGTVEVRVPVCRLSETIQAARTDDIDLPFTDDPEVIGRWLWVDTLPERACFNPRRKAKTGGEVRPLYFLPGGVHYGMFGWTKSQLLVTNQDGTFTWPYEVFEIKGRKFMFVEQKGGEYIYYGGQPQILVFRQADARPYTADELRVYDRTDRPFENDERVLGRWVACDPRLPSVFYKYAHFKPGGLFEGRFGDRIITSPDITWTRGYCLHHHVKTAPAYRIKRVGNADLLYLEWKSNDYVFAGKKPKTLVFKREESK